MNHALFQYCLNTFTLGKADVPLADKITATAAAGYAGIEPWIKELDAYVARGGTLDDLRRRIDDRGMKVVNLIGFFDWAVPDEPRRRAGMEEARRSFDLAQRLGCPYVAAPPCGMTDIAGADLLAIARRYAELIDLGAAFGVTPLLEFWGFSKTLGHLGEALCIAAECGRSEARILADVFHIYKSSRHFNGLDLLGPRTLGLFHINDYPASDQPDTLVDADRVYPGDGVAPLTHILAQLRAGGYRGMLSLELFNQVYWKQELCAIARTGLEKLQRVVAALA